MFVKPAPGALVRDPVTMRELPPEGAEIDATDFHWDRLLRDGDIILAAPPVPDEPQPAGKAAPTVPESDPSSKVTEE